MTPSTMTQDDLLFRASQCLSSAEGMGYENAGVPVSDLRALIAALKVSTLTQDDLVELIAAIQVDIDREERDSGGPDDGNPWHTFQTRISDVKKLFAIAQSLTAENIALREAIRTARARFYEYADSHKAKGTTEGDVKAARNLEMAEMLSASLQPKESDR